MWNCPSESALDWGRERTTLCEALGIYAYVTHKAFEQLASRVARRSTKNCRSTTLNHQQQPARTTN
ncbi:hypothetical protein NECAME_11263 [Necator americanus]|uniref:Uncharacterized protein n=1 Tax=Necator americanus TaxID=51031 RepID=W2T4Z7_NECAM|nr:hypothetical protein NECAME_11263 [Necator americanus]ETN77105.1 hypothetical protein NECAME_11263 [Necator americanus]